MLPRALEITQQSFLLVLVLSVPALAAAAGVGVLVGLLGMVLPLHEPSVTQLPRVVMVALVLVTLGGAGAASLVRFTHDLWQAIPVLLR